MKKSKKLIKVNLGCGSNIQKGFINIDNYYLPDHKEFLQGDARNLPLESNSVDYLLCDQMLEHLPMADILMVLYEIRRVLKVGGKAIIMVPDFEDVAKAWLEFNHNAGFNPLMYRWLSDPIYGNQLHEGEFHKTPMCAGFLHYNLNIAGLTKHEISFWPRDGKIPQFDGINYYPEKATLRNAQLVVDLIKV